MRPPNWIVSLVILVFCLLSVGCFSFHPIPPPEPGVYGRLRIVTRNGERYEMLRVQVDSTTVSGHLFRGEGLEFPLEQVGVFEERRFSVEKTAGLVVVSVPAGLGLWVLAWLAGGAD